MRSYQQNGIVAEKQKTSEAFVASTSEVCTLVWNCIKYGVLIFDKTMNMIQAKLYTFYKTAQGANLVKRVHFLLPLGRFNNPRNIAAFEHFDKKKKGTAVAVP